jgi:hypothetical protein
VSLEGNLPLINPINLDTRKARYVWNIKGHAIKPKPTYFMNIVSEPLTISPPFVELGRFITKITNVRYWSSR